MLCFLLADSHYTATNLIQITALKIWRDSEKHVDLDTTYAARLVAKQKTAIKGIRERI